VHINRELCEAGKKVMAESSVAICGLARDCAGKLKSLMPQLERLGSAFRSSRFIAVENDSKDATAEILEQWRDRNPSVQVIRFCYAVTPESPMPQASAAGGGWFGPGRMQRMVFARNLYLEALAETAVPDFVCVIDLDILSFSLAGVEHSFGLLDDWDVVTANGTRYSVRNPLRPLVYWDSYAYEPFGGFDNGVQTPGEIRSNQTDVSRLLSSGGLVRAWSAFGGLGIYRGRLLGDHRYSVVQNDDPAVPVLCDHPTLHRSMRQEHPDLRLMINPLMRVSYGTAPELMAQTVRRLAGKAIP